MRHNIQMPPPSQGDRPARVNKCLCGHDRHATWESAERMRKYLQAIDDFPLRIYECNYGWFHLGPTGEI